MMVCIGNNQFSCIPVLRKEDEEIFWLKPYHKNLFLLIRYNNYFKICAEEEAKAIISQYV